MRFYLKYLFVSPALGLHEARVSELRANNGIGPIGLIGYPEH